MTSTIQACIFPKDLFTTQQARLFLKKHNLKPIKRVHTTKNFYRYRIKNPDTNKRHVTKKLTNGVEIILEMKVV